MPARGNNMCPTCKVLEREAGRTYCRGCRNIKQRANRRVITARAQVKTGLTVNEIRVLRLMCQGLCMKRIARRMDTTVAAVKQFQYKLRKFTTCTGQAQLGVWAVQHGYVHIASGCTNVGSPKAATINGCGLSSFSASV